MALDSQNHEQFGKYAIKKPVQNAIGVTNALIHVYQASKPIGKQMESENETTRRKTGRTGNILYKISGVEKKNYSDRKNRINVEVVEICSRIEYPSNFNHNIHRSSAIHRLDETPLVAANPPARLDRRRSCRRPR
jgi:hypothetical protein